jgi:3-oxoacyl-(acyl-carrier-protein) synthase
MHTVITGCGWVTPRAAGDISTVLQAYSNHGGEALSKTRYDPVGPEIFSPFTNLPGEAAKEDAVRLAAVALEIAWKQAGLSGDSYASDRKGLVLGCALAGVSGMIDFANDVRTQSARFVSPIRFPQTVGNYICGALARGYDFRGPASTIACGTASSLECIREGCALLSSGLADVVIAGGTELLSPEIVEGLNQPDVRLAAEGLRLQEQRR